ncbi:MAG: kynureninase [Rhizobiales bacterium]|nr:kynureninase [Hyphomicrobiales bacterium]
MTTNKAHFPLKEQFQLPKDTIYLDGNSLGPLQKLVNKDLSDVINTEWGEHLITAWNIDAWMEQPLRVGNLIGKIIGAPEGSVMMGDTLSIKVYQALSAALQMRPTRKIILSDSGNFPTDLYIAQGLIAHLNNGYELKIVEPEEIESAISKNVAAVMITQVDYRTGRLHDMKSITQKAHEMGSVMIWDLAHSAGAVELDLEAINCEFAVGCTYKFLNGGPGSPAFIYVRPDLTEQIAPALSGWMGHEAPFAFDQSYRPALSIERMRVGTPPVVQLSILESALQIWHNIDMKELRTASIALSELFIEQVEKRCPQLILASPKNPEHRGSQVSFKFKNGYAVVQALIANGLIGDFRAPNIIRFGITPLYISEADIHKAVDIIVNIMENNLWEDPKFNKANRVT